MSRARRSSRPQPGHDRNALSRPRRHRRRNYPAAGACESTSPAHAVAGLYPTNSGKGSPCYGVRGLSSARSSALLRPATKAAATAANKHRQPCPAPQAAPTPPGPRAPPPPATRTASPPAPSRAAEFPRPPWVPRGRWAPRARPFARCAPLAPAPLYRGSMRGGQGNTETYFQVLPAIRAAGPGGWRRPGRLHAPEAARTGPVSASRSYLSWSPRGRRVNGQNGHFSCQAGRNHVGTLGGRYGSGFNGPRAVFLVLPNRRRVDAGISAGIWDV
jgi:hypothetical protein